MKRIIIIFSFLFFIVTPVQASDYVLPYPSYMPGNVLHKVRQALERVQEYWYFGDMAKVKYHLKMADKYLVEAKTLFEYQQSKLAVISLEKSNYHFSNAVLYEMDVTHDKKDDGKQKQQLREAGEKHAAIIEVLKKELPDKIDWQEEKKEKEEISLSILFDQAALIRGYANR